MSADRIELANSLRYASRLVVFPALRSGEEAHSKSMNWGSVVTTSLAAGTEFP